MLKKVDNRLLARAARKRRLVFAGTYQTATERMPGGLFPHPAKADIYS
jgi:hypothetical protein